MKKADVQSRIRKEFKAWHMQPKVEKDWGVIWVLSGYDTGWEKGSDTRRRLEAGMRLANKIKQTNGGRIPAVYISGYDAHNTNLKKWRSDGFFEKNYSFAKKHLLVGPQEHIRHTGDQFRLFPRKFLKGNKKIVIITDAYHLPRVRRHAAKFFPDERQRFVFYPAKPLTMSAGDIQRESQKIIEYSDKGIIPLFIDTKKIVLSGATGLLGTRFLAALSRTENVLSVSLGREAFKNRKLLQAKLRGADIVFHLAGVNRANDPKDFQFNVSSTKALLAAMRDAAPDSAFVYTSSFAVYRPPHKGQLVTEKFSLQPRNAYGKSKLTAENIITTVSKKNDISSIIFRISNMYGPGQKASRAILDQIRGALKSGKSITMHTDTAATRDFVYVDDVVAALMRLINRPHKKGSFETFNICSGEEVSIEGVIKTAEKIGRRKLRVNQSGEYSERATYWRGSFQKAKKGLQWQPKVKIREGLRKTLV